MVKTKVLIKYVMPVSGLHILKLYGICDSVKLVFYFLCKAISTTIWVSVGIGPDYLRPTLLPEGTGATYVKCSFL